jgi:hypothetical protein
MIARQAGMGRTISFTFSQIELFRRSALEVRRAKAALFQWVRDPPGYCSGRKLPKQSGR